jgi:hypothetical protein
VQLMATVAEAGLDRLPAASRGALNPAGRYIDGSSRNAAAWASQRVGLVVARHVGAYAANGKTQIKGNGRPRENSTGDISVTSEESCIFRSRCAARWSSSDMLQKPVHRRLKKLNKTTYE